MRLTAIHAETERKRQDRSVCYAAKDSRRSRTALRIQREANVIGAATSKGPLIEEKSVRTKGSQAPPGLRGTSALSTSVIRSVPTALPSSTAINMASA
jgi:hypothetical protein